jgi:hypothetical protein
MAKNLPKTPQKSFMIPLTKNLLKTSKYNKNFLILPNILNLNKKL